MELNMHSTAWNAAQHLSALRYNQQHQPCGHVSIWSGTDTSPTKHSASSYYVVTYFSENKHFWLN
jgi:hypothetical protein